MPRSAPLASWRCRQHRRAALQRLDDSAVGLSDSELLGLQWDLYEALRFGQPHGVARAAQAALDLLSLETERRGSASPFETRASRGGAVRQCDRRTVGPDSHLPY